jgi:glycosyltransferase involved in cell wall biosynthesis
VNKPIPLTVIFTTFNEEHNIGIALDTVRGWASEIIVVDSFSTDKTEAIVRQFPEINFIQHPYEGPAFQKNWAIPQAKNEWVLLMDADERVSKDMQLEIEQIIQMSDSAVLKTQNPKLKTQKDCYWIGFTHYFMVKK